MIFRSNHSPRATGKSRRSKIKLENENGQDRLMKLILQKKKLDKISNEIDMDILSKDI